MDSQNISKCFMGIKAESLVVGLAMPKFQLDQLAFASTHSKEIEELGRIPFSRKYITYTDKAFWNIFLNLFSPKEFEKIDSYLNPLSIYIRISEKVICVGQSNWFSNIDIFFKKELFSFSPQTWSKFKELEEKSLNKFFQNWCDDLSDQWFYQDRNFSVIYKNWISKKSSISSFFVSYIGDWYQFLKTDEGMKLWRIVPAFYKIKVDLFPTQETVAEFIFNLIQPHYYFDEENFAEDVSKYLILNKTFFNNQNKFNVVEEENKILHLVIEKNNPIRSEKYWDFPEPIFTPTKSGLVNWSWIVKLDADQRSQIDRKIIIDLSDFVIEQHYFTGIIALIDHDYELLFLQKTQTLYDKQLEDKLLNKFQECLKFDDFWATWNKSLSDLSLKKFQGPKIESSFIYSIEGDLSRHVKWNKNSSLKNSINYKEFSLLSENKSYWVNYFYNITRILWSELYNSKF